MNIPRSIAQTAPQSVDEADRARPVQSRPLAGLIVLAGSLGLVWALLGAALS